MAQEASPFTHPAEGRFHELLDEAEELYGTKRAQYGTDLDPYANYRTAEEWGAQPWVACMFQVDGKLARLRNLANGINIDGAAYDAFLDVAVGTLNGLVLYEQMVTHQELSRGEYLAQVSRRLMDVSVRLARQAKDFIYPPPPTSTEPPPPTAQEAPPFLLPKHDVHAPSSYVYQPHVYDQDEEDDASVDVAALHHTDPTSLDDATTALDEELARLRRAAEPRQGGRP